MACLGWRSSSQRRVRAGDPVAAATLLQVGAREDVGSSVRAVVLKMVQAFAEPTVPPRDRETGQQDRRLRLQEPVLAGDMARVTRPWTKWSAEVQRVEDVPTATRRAVQTALTPPTGPVFLALAVDVQFGSAGVLSFCSQMDRPGIDGDLHPNAGPPQLLDPPWGLLCVNGNEHLGTHAAHELEQLRSAGVPGGMIA